jgi:Carboxypeptidase regulatory-like domain/TonB-dependent Receptor Plug Domain
MTNVVTLSRPRNYSVIENFLGSASAYCLSFILLLGLSHSSVNAQDITKGSISGVVRDPSGAVISGAVVSLSSPFGDRSAKTSSTGEYSFLNLQIGGGYTVSVTSAGFTRNQTTNLNVSVNHQTNADFVLKVGTGTTEVTVTDTASAVDTSSTTIGANLDAELYKNIPIGRNISSVMAMAPGVADSDGAGTANPSINGASGLENEYIINGANTTDPGFGGFGTYSRVYGPLGNGINFDFVQEVQMQTGGFEAQYGEALGGVINVLTKSGSDSFHGDVFGYFQPQQFEATRKNADPLLVNKADYLAHLGSIDYGADLGGYVIKDKLFFYAGFNPLTNHQYKRADPSFANYALGVVDKQSKTYDYTAKINYNLGSKHQFEGSVFGDPSSTPMQFNAPVSTVLAPAPVDTTVESKLNYGTRTWTGRYTGALTSHWVMTVNYSNYYNSFTETPKANGYQITDNTPVEAGTGGSFTYGGLGFIEGSESKVNQVAASSSHIFTFFGNHNITLGYQFEDDVYNDIQKYTGATFTLPNIPALGQAAGQTVYGAAFTRTYENPNDPTSPVVLDFTRGNYSSPAVVAETRYQSGYIQDTWSFGRFTIKPGLRFEQQSMIGNQQSYVFGHNWAPRIGVIFDPFNDRKTKIAASWGRFYEKIPLDISVREFSLQQGLTGLLYADPGVGAQPNLSTGNYIPGGTIAFQGTGGLTPIAGGTGAQYQDEVTGSVEHEFSHNLTLTGRFVYRDLRRILEDTSGVNVTQALAGVPQQYVIANPSAKLDIYQNSVPCISGANCNSATGYTNFANGTDNPLGSDGTPDGFPNASRIYKSMELIISKRFSNLQVYGNYTLSKLFGNFQGSYRSDNFQQDPNISSLFDFTNSDGRLTGQDTPGVLPTDRTHQLKLFGNYQWKAVNFGFGWTPTSGTPITELNDHPVYENAGEIPVGARGALGRTAWIFPLNAHVDYTWKFSERARLKLIADMFNLANQQRVVRVNQYHEVGDSPGVLNPDFLLPAQGTFLDPYQEPFSARLAIRLEF